MASAAAWMRPICKPATQRQVSFLVNAHPSWSIYFAKPADGTYGWAGADYGVWGKAVLEAIDYQTGKIRWSHELGPGGGSAGVLTTDSGVTFTGDAHGNVVAFDTRTGKTLWHAGTGAPMETSPLTFELDGRQVVNHRQRRCPVRVGAAKTVKRFASSSGAGV